jgi:hypothetical protein
MYSQTAERATLSIRREGLNFPNEKYLPRFVEMQKDTPQSHLLFYFYQPQHDERFDDW